MTRKAALFFAVVLPAGLHAASYLPLSDADLVRRSPVVVDAEVVGETHLTAQRPGEAGLPYSLVPLRVRDVLKGEAPTEILLRLPGGIAPNGGGTYFPGTPTFEVGTRVILFLAPSPKEGQYSLTEFALSKFDVLEDSVGQLFAVRSTFQAGDDFYLSPEPGRHSEPDAVRDLASLLAAVRASHGSSMPEVWRGLPVGGMRPHADGRAPLWLLVDERGSGRLVRWFWDTGLSLTASVKIVGTQSNLSDSSNGASGVQNAITQWASIPSTSVLTGGPSASGNVTVNLDVDVQPNGAWSTPLGCGGGTVGLGGPTYSLSPSTFKGEVFYPVVSGNVWIRRITCASGYPVAQFRSTVLHELGHVICLDHPDQGQNAHSTTTSTDWANAVMHSVLPAAYPATPQTDDIQAMQYLYPSTGSCGYSINPTSSSVAASSASGSVTVTTTAGCAWTATSNAAFLTITSGASGSGSGSVGYSASANTGSARSGTLTIAGNTFTVTQSAAASCSYALGGNGASYSAAAASGSVPVTTTAGCAWTATSNAAFLAITSGASGSGSGTVGYSVSENTGSARSGTLTIAGQTFTVSQSAASGGGSCVPSATALCISNRFKIQVSWSTSQGGGLSGAATAVAAAPLGFTAGGIFWFFDAANPEMLVKVLNGCAVNNRFWVFETAGTNVGFTMTVTDTANSIVKQYVNADLTSALPIADTTAFATCP